jgi:3-deoxy-D-manno-octulosonate 8-phosphate phosphatase (KDO 8-P phosphatase)
LNPEFLIFDVDGVFTDGKFYYTSKGKHMKVFGPDDATVIGITKEFIKIVVITADKRGFSITRKRIQEDLHLELHLVGEVERIKWIEERYPVASTIYMGDGVLDPLVFKKVAYSIAPKNASEQVRRKADFVTKTSGGDRAVAEACLHILKKFFGQSILD